MLRLVHAKNKTEMLLSKMVMTKQKFYYFTETM